MSMQSEKLENLLTLPKNMSGRLILGARPYGGKWNSMSNKVTGLNIFSSRLSVGEMARMTQDENCVKKGDYLAWEDMEWVLYGKARLEMLDINEPCETAPLANFFNAPFPSWGSCMHS